MRASVKAGLQKSLQIESFVWSAIKINNLSDIRSLTTRRLIKGFIQPVHGPGLNLMALPRNGFPEPFQ